ncbi:MAG: IS30 family transposase [Polyangiaceae bacterium]|nr:IS30 family transposase [Polyangiaceae bacterium]
MTRATRRPFSPDEKKELWRRWKAGESLSVIARAQGRKPATISGFLAAHGGVAPAAAVRGERGLSCADREGISRGLAAGDSMRAIARAISRPPSTVHREIARNGGRLAYRAARAEERAHAQRRRPKPRRLGRPGTLRTTVIEKLEELWSPEQIAGWLRLEYPRDLTMWISHETIYRALYLRDESLLGRGLVKCLRTRRRMRRSRQSTTSGQARGQIVGAVSIRLRPRAVETRRQVGHWEGDLITGSSNTHIATLVERHSRATILVRVDGKDSLTVTNALSRVFKRMPSATCRSLTWDRGTELAQHQVFTRKTGVPVYFCDPQSPWQRGTNENTNGLLRQYFPKGTRLDASQVELDRVALALNSRPRKTLGFQTPAHALGKVLR